MFMRNLTLVLLAATSLATPAMGQVSPQAQQQLDLLTQQQLDRQRSIALENQLKSLTLDPAAKPLFMAGWDVLWDFADTLVTEREASGLHDENSLLDDIIAAKQRGDLDATEARFMVLTVAVAGYDTSKNQLTTTMKLLLDRPDLYERCAEDLQFCRRITEESLRHSAIASPFREAAHDFTYDGHQFRKGDTIVMAPPLANRDGGMAGANIRTGLLFDPIQLHFVERGHAGPEDHTGIRLNCGKPCLTLNPGRIAPTHPAFAGDHHCHWAPSRKALAAEFEIEGQRLFVIACHFKSMRAISRREADYTKKQRHFLAEKALGA